MCFLPPFGDYWYGWKMNLKVLTFMFWLLSVIGFDMCVLLAGSGGWYQDKVGFHKFTSHMLLLEKLLGFLQRLDRKTEILSVSLQAPHYTLREAGEIHSSDETGHYSQLGLWRAKMCELRVNPDESLLSTLFKGLCKSHAFYGFRINYNKMISLK